MRDVLVKVITIALITSLVANLFFFVPVYSSDDIISEEEITEEIKDDELDETDEETESLEPTILLADRSQVLRGLDLPNNDSSESDSIKDFSSIKISKVQIGLNGDGQDEFIEIYNSSSNDINLKSLRVDYLISSAELDAQTSPKYILKTFTKDTVIPGFSSYVLFSQTYDRDFVLDDDTETKDFFDIFYKYTYGMLPSNGVVALINTEIEGSYDSQMVDLVGWGNAKIFETEAATSANIMVRCVNQATLLIQDTDNNRNDFSVVDSVEPLATVFCPEYEEENLNDCYGLVLSEIGANLSLESQFIEVYNTSTQDLDISGCGIKTNRSSKIFTFDNLELLPSQYYAVNISQTSLTLTKTTGGVVTLLSEQGDEINQIQYANLKADTSWSLIGGVWKQTYAVTPDAKNQFTEFMPCSIGYERNLETGRCRKITEDEPLPDCGPGKFRNPATGRCKSYTTLTSVLAPCKNGYYRNPETNRCKKIEVASSPAPCKEGYERNAETGRCRKIKENIGADYAVIPTEVQERSQFVGGWALAAVVGGGLVFIGVQKRQETLRLIRRIFRRQTSNR